MSDITNLSRLFFNVGTPKEKGHLFYFDVVDFDVGIRAKSFY